jgi:hypothetical protein
MTTTNRLLPLLLCVIGLVAGAGAMAHGDGKPKHGGIVQTSEDIDFELVADAHGVTIYLEDDDQPLPSAGFSGKLTATQGGAQTAVPLKPAGDNKLMAAGLALKPGDKVVVVVVTPQKQTISLRFAPR